MWCGVVGQYTLLRVHADVKPCIPGLKLPVKIIILSAKKKHYFYVIYRKHKTNEYEEENLRTIRTNTYCY